MGFPVSLTYVVPFARLAVTSCHVCETPSHEGAGFAAAFVSELTRETISFQAELSRGWPQETFGRFAAAANATTVQTAETTTQNPNQSAAPSAAFVVKARILTFGKLENPPHDTGDFH